MHGAASEKSGDTAPAARLTEIRIDDETWAAASKERRHEWRVVLDDLIAEHRFAAALPERLRLLITQRAGRILFDAQAIDAAGDDALHDEIRLADLERHLREYLKICIDMGQLDLGANSPNLETLDMAKRLAHGDAARTLQRLFRALRPDYPTARRLFTLIVTLHFDTTRLVRPHHLDATVQSLRWRERGGDE